MDSKLEQLLESARQRQMSQEEAELQRINFAYGNAPEEDKRCTVDSIRAAADYMKKSTNT